MKPLVVLSIVVFCGLGAPNVVSTTNTTNTTTAAGVTPASNPTNAPTVTSTPTPAPVLCANGKCEGDACNKAITSNCTLTNVLTKCSRTSTGNATHPIYTFACESSCVVAAKKICCDTQMCNTPPKPNNGAGTVTPTIIFLFSLLAIVFLM